MINLVRLRHSLPSTDSGPEIAPRTIGELLQVRADIAAALVDFGSAGVRSVLLNRLEEVD